MQNDLLRKCPYLLSREDRDTGDLVLKKNRELEEITFKSLNKGHNVFKKLCLHSRTEEVRLDLEIVVKISPFLSSLHSELRDCCCTPHDQVHVFLDQFHPQLLHHLKQIVELGECGIISETEMNELNDLIHALGMSHLPIFSGPVYKPSRNLHPEGERSLVATIDVEAQNNAVEDDTTMLSLRLEGEKSLVASIDIKAENAVEDDKTMLNLHPEGEKSLVSSIDIKTQNNAVDDLDSPVPNIPSEDANSLPVDLNQKEQVLKSNSNDSRTKEPEYLSQDIKRPKRRLSRDKTKWEQRCSRCQQYFDGNQRHVCAISNRKRARSLAEDDELNIDARKIKARNKRHISSENNFEHELKQEYIEDDRSEPTKKFFKLKRGTSVSEEHKNIFATSSEESRPTGLKICSTSPEDTNPSFPLASRSEESSLGIGDTAYAMQNNQQKEFKKCRITGKGESSFTYKVQFEANRSKSNRAGRSLTVAGKELAYFESSKYELPVGTRCIAIWTEEPDDVGSFFPAIVAQSPTPENNYRYLVFFDDGYMEYFSLKDLRKIVDQGNEDGMEGSCISDFIKNYNPVLPFTVGDLVEMYVIEVGRWVEARVVDIDASLVFIDSGDDYEREWIYRGHPRLRYIGHKPKNSDQDCDEKMSFEEEEVVPCQLCGDADYKETSLSEHLYRKHEDLKKQMMRSITDKFSPDTSIYTIEKQKRNWTCSICGEEMKGMRSGVGLHWAVEHQQIKILYDSALKEKNDVRKSLQRKKCTELREEIKKLNSSGPTPPTDETLDSNNEFEVNSVKADLKAPVKDETNLKAREIRESSSKQTESHKITTDSKETNACSMDVVVSNKRDMDALEMSFLKNEASKHQLGDFSNKLKDEVIEKLWFHYLKFHPTQLKNQSEYHQENVQTMRRQLFSESDSDRNSDTDFSD